VKRPHVLLLTGSPGVGKTTALRKVAAGLGRRRLRGFYTEEIRHRGQRQGFRAVTFDGRAATMAHVSVPGSARVGKYGVDVAVVDDLARSTLAVDRDTQVYLVDEIGKMECLSREFVAAMRALLDAGHPVVATVGLRGAGLIAEVKRRPDAETWAVTHANRTEIPERALGWLKDRLPE
jgi:nucleoside-triphosphatase